MSEKNRGGAPRGNTNARVHGGRSGTPGLCLGSWGARHTHAMREALKFRRWLLAQCEQTHGQVGPMDTVWIDVASQADMSVRVLKRLIANAKPGELSAKDEADLVGRIMNYSGIKQRAIGKLRLQADKPTSAWDEIDAMGVESLQGDDTGDPGEDTDLDTTGDCEAASGVQGYVGGDRRNPTEFWAEVDREIAADRETNGDPQTPGAD